MTETTTMAKETIKLALESCIMTFYMELKNSEPNQGFEEKLDTQKKDLRGGGGGGGGGNNSTQHPAGRKEEY